MSGKITFPNWQSRLLLGSVARKQPIQVAQLPRPVESFFHWYERRILKVDVSHVSVDRPIFLIGMPRSGTTVLQDVVCAHPEVACVNNTMNRFPRTFCAIEHFRRRLRLDFVGERYLGDSILVSASSPSDAVALWAEWFKNDPHSLEYHKVEKADLSQAVIQHIDEMIRKVIWCQGPPARRFFSKLFTALPHLEVMRDVFPQAKYIHIIRDGRMTANSMVKHCRKEKAQQKRAGLQRQNADGGQQFFIPYPRFPRLAEYVKEYGAEDVRTTAHLWNDAISYVDGVKETFAEFHEVRYEDILQNPEEEMGRLFEFCELPAIGKEDTAFWKRIDGIGKVGHVNKYEDFDRIEEICRENLAKHGYLDGSS